MSDMSEFEEDGMATDTQLKVISNLIKRQIELEDAVLEATAVLKKANAELRKCAEGDLPDAMDAAGVSIFKTHDGDGVDVSEKLTASISKKNKPKAIEWLIEHGLASLVKENVTVPFDKGEGEKVKALVDMLESHGVSDFSVIPTVNTSSVKSALKELLEQGVDVPSDTFGLFHFKQAVVERAP